MKKILTTYGTFIFVILILFVLNYWVGNPVKDCLIRFGGNETYAALNPIEGTEITMKMLIYIHSIHINTPTELKENCIPGR